MTLERKEHARLTHDVADMARHRVTSDTQHVGQETGSRRWQIGVWHIRKCSGSQ